MTTIVKIHRKGQMTLPTRLRSLAGIAEGDLVQATYQRGKIVITPTLVIDRSKFPTADDEYTPEQRRIIDARLDKADQDIKAGRMSKAFSSHEEFIADLHKAAKKYGIKKTKRSAK
ncbi:MAG: AbrB/MazE/SpoVT family DNA-binding domain-containing protein [Acidobacteriia bacterium]|nr:AbrB/MazE/SpoVT family DNA-binding domain-containing protein [Terriglobia bacterium]